MSTVRSSANEFLATLGIAVLLYGVLTPVRFLLRIFGRGVLDSGFSDRSTSYWIVPTQAQTDSMPDRQWGRVGMSLVGEIINVFRARGKAWILPIVAVTVVWGALIPSGNSEKRPEFIYTLF